MPLREEEEVAEAEAAGDAATARRALERAVRPVAARSRVPARAARAARPGDHRDPDLRQPLVHGRHQAHRGHERASATRRKTGSSSCPPRPDAPASSARMTEGPRPLPRDRAQGRQPAVLRGQAGRQPAPGLRGPGRVQGAVRCRDGSRSRLPDDVPLGAARASGWRAVFGIANFSRVHEAPRDLDALERRPLGRCARPQSFGSFRVTHEAVRQDVPAELGRDRPRGGRAPSTQATGVRVDLEHPELTRVRRGPARPHPASRSRSSRGRAASRSAARAAWWRCSRAASTRRWRPGA